MPHAEIHISTHTNGEFRLDEDVDVRPLGLFDGTEFSLKVFNWPLDPEGFR